MRALPWTLSCLVASLVVGCGAPPAPDANGTDAGAGTSMEFRGERPCTDCTAIESWLRLEQQAGAQRYRLVEHYRAGERRRRFEDVGNWTSEGDLLRLRSRNGGERVYARMADGQLQARDAHGEPLPAAADDVMVPVTFDAVR